MIRPSDIDTRQYFWGAFDHTETEISARFVVLLCQKVGDWKPFTFYQINRFYQRLLKAEGIEPDKFTFNRLVFPEVKRDRLRGITTMDGGGWIELDTHMKYRVTQNFIVRCHERFPAPLRRRSSWTRLIDDADGL